MNASAKYEIAVIGGGPAGSTAAIYFNKYGFNVCLIEKKVFPREVLCGEFLSHEVTDILNDLGLIRNFMALGPNPINSIKFSDSHGIDIKSDLGFTAYGLRRGKFDSLLLNEAKCRGVNVLQPAEVKEITRKDGKYFLKVSSEHNSIFEITAGKIIAAFGKQNSLDKFLGRKYFRTKTGINGVKFHIPSKFSPKFSKREIQIYSSNGIYCGVNAVDDDILTVCFLENKDLFNGSSREHLKYLMKKNKAFGELFIPEVKEFIGSAPVYGVGDIYFGRKPLTDMGIIMIGDAARVIAPLAGDGISMAMQSGKIIAGIIKLHASSEDSTIARIYESEWKKKFRRRVAVSREVQKIIISRVPGLPVLKIAKVFPSAIEYIIRLTRG